MADRPSNVVLNFKMNGQVQYAQTVREINAIMNTAAREYKNHVAAMGEDAKATEKLTAEKKKLEIQMEAAKKRTEMLRAQYEAMSRSTKTTTGQLAQMYGKLLDAERAEISLQRSMERVNDELSEQGQSVREAKDSLSQLANEMQLLEAEQRKLASSFELQNAALDENASEAEKVELAQKQIRDQMQLTEKVVATLEQQLEQAKKAYGENSKEVIELETKLNGAKTSMAKFSQELENVGNSAQQAESKLDGVNNGLQALAGAAPAAAIGAIALNTQEAAIQFAMLETQAKNAGLSLSDFENSQNMFASVNQDVNQTTEAMGNLVKAGYTTEEQLTSISEAISGAIVAYGETFNAEGLAESITTTTQLGEVTGQLTDLLEKEGVNVDSFNEKIQSMSSAQERANYISKVLADEGLNAMYQEYAKGYPEIIEATAAQRENEEALADLGNVLRPLVTDVVQFTTKLIEWANANPTLTRGLAVTTAAIGALVAASAFIAPIVTAIATVMGTATISIGALGTAIAGIAAPIAIAIAAFAAIALAIKGFIDLGKLLYENWDSIAAFLAEIWEGIKNVAVNVFNSIIDFFKEWGPDILAILAGPIGILVRTIIDNWETIKTKTSEVFNKVKDFMVKPIEKAKDLIKLAIDKVVSFFRNLGDKLKITIPKPKIPTFKIKGEFDLVPPGISVPKIDIKWHAQGGIMTRPTVFGASGNTLLAGGEAGAEGIIPLTPEVLGKIGDGIAKTMNLNNGTGEVTIPITLELDGETIARKTVRYNARELYNYQQSKNRGGGRM